MSEILAKYRDIAEQYPRKEKAGWEAVFARLAELEEHLSQAGIVVKQIKYKMLYCGELIDRVRPRAKILDSFDRMWFRYIAGIKVSYGRIGKWLDYSEAWQDAAEIVEQALAILPEQKFSGYAKIFRSLIAKRNLGDRWAIYPTTYGIGIWVFYNWNAEKDTALVKELMQGSGISYENEFSNAKWVYRFKISHSRENLARLEEYLQRA